MPCRPRAFFFLNDTAPTEIYPLSLHDSLPISGSCRRKGVLARRRGRSRRRGRGPGGDAARARTPGARRARRVRTRSEEHTSELQSRLHLVCRLLLEKKKKKRVRKISAV